MSPDDPMKSCSCPHPVSGHEAKSGACFVDGCLCGWEVRGGVKYRSHPLYDSRITPFYNVAHVIPEPSFPVRQRIPAPVPGERKLRDVQRRFPGKPCYYCGGKAESIDHFVPRAAGGKNVLSNLVPACMKCNHMKGAFTYEEFIAHIEKVLQMARTSRVNQQGGSLWRVVAA